MKGRPMRNQCEASGLIVPRLMGGHGRCPLCGTTWHSLLRTDPHSENVGRLRAHRRTAAASLEAVAAVIEQRQRQQKGTL